MIVFASWLIFFGIVAVLGWLMGLLVAAVHRYAERCWRRVCPPRRALRITVWVNGVRKLDELAEDIAPPRTLSFTGQVAVTFRADDA